MVFLKSLWDAFLFVPKILGALFMGNGTYIVSALILFTLVILIESLLFRYFLKTKYLKIVPRMILVNIADVIIQLIAAIPLSYLFDAGITFVFVSCMIMLFCRFVTSYYAYAWLDRDVNLLRLKRAVIVSNCVSYIFVVAVIFISRTAHHPIFQAYFKINNTSFN